MNQILSFEKCKRIITENDELLSSRPRDVLLFKATPLGETTYQCWNKEYIEQLALAIKKLKVNSPILEVCAGDGKLSQYLNHHDINIIGTDDFSWANITRSNNNVQRFDAIEAIKSFKPELVIASWIPYTDSTDHNILLTKIKHFS